MRIYIDSQKKKNIITIFMKQLHKRTCAADEFLLKRFRVK